MPKTVGVAVSNATFHFDKLYTYAVMPAQQDAVRLGSMVLVPFGRGSRARMGVVLACDAEPESSKLKYLFDVAPASACLTPELLKLVYFLKERTFCTYYEAVKAVIPYGAQYKPAVAADGVTPVLQKQLTRHTENSYQLAGELPAKPKPTAKQLAAVALLSGGPRTQGELEEKGISRAVLDNLCTKGVLACTRVNRSIDLYASIPLQNEPIVLTEEQQAAYGALLPHLEDTAPHSALLYGVTGSGKTLVFLKLIERCLQLGRKALVLVPEISLTPQMILRLKSQFGRRVAVQHSALNHTERLLQWQMIQDGGADIVVGTRSAIFSPLENIGLVIIDEEQEHTYRSESAPRYSAHEVARQRAAENGALLLLASATPSTESYFAAQKGRTQLVRLTKRYGGNPLPSVQIVDMRAELASGNPREISLALEDTIRRNLEAHKQTILLLNRRGYQTVAQCEDCREVLKCPKCSVPMVYHKASAQTALPLLWQPAWTHRPKNCARPAAASCNTGALAHRKQRKSLQSSSRKPASCGWIRTPPPPKTPTRSCLARFADHEYDIMVGTQMVAKGLDFEDVTLVGVLGIDSLLFAQGFRAYENGLQPHHSGGGPERQGQRARFCHHPDHRPGQPGSEPRRRAGLRCFLSSRKSTYRRLGLVPAVLRALRHRLCRWQRRTRWPGRQPVSRRITRASRRPSSRICPCACWARRPATLKKSTTPTAISSPSSAATTAVSGILSGKRWALYEQEKLPSKASVVVDLHSDGDI